MLDGTLFSVLIMCLFFPPTDEEIVLLMRWNLSFVGLQEINWKRMISAARGLSQAVIVRATETVVKTALLDERKFVTAEDVAQALDCRHEIQKFSRINIKSYGKVRYDYCIAY